MRIRFFIFLLIIVVTACTTSDRPKEISFYYWKSVFRLNAIEKQTLKENKCSAIYMRYFDVVKEEGVAKPVSVIQFKDTVKEIAVIPVVFIKNNVFQNTDSAGVGSVARNILSLIQQISSANLISNHEIQFDCDWTESTKHNFFCFLRRIKTAFKGTVSATIRLHQIKYNNITGVPPVDKGVLMYYNTGEINSSFNNSIYEKKTAAKYLSALKDYPLALDVALPVFSWGIQLRSNKVIRLLNKLNETHFGNDTNFILKPDKKYLVRASCFKEGYYFTEGDEIKLEAIKQDELPDMAEDLRSNLSQSPSVIIFYDLDSVNLMRYEKNIFKNTLAGFN